MKDKLVGVDKKLQAKCLSISAKILNLPVVSLNQKNK